LPALRRQRAVIEQLAEILRIRGVDFATLGVIFDIGSRDGLQAVEFSNLFPEADIVAIECNRQTLERCRRNLADKPRITLIDKAINSHTGRCTFYPIDPTRTITTWKDGNPGASSLFIATGDYPVETYVQNEVEVDCIRLDDLCQQLHINAIDLIWMDLQGAELIALQSAGSLLEKVRYIYTEVSHRPIYKDQCLFEDVDAFLTGRGFRRCTTIDPARWQQDAIYENTRELIDVVIPLGPEDLDMADFSVRSLRACVRDVRNIYLVSAEDPNIPGTHFFDQRNFPFDIDSVRQNLGSQAQPAQYFQQLVKLYFPLVNRACLQNVLVMDPDTVFLRPCGFIEDRRPVFNFGDSYHPSHFEHMARLFPALRRMFAYSGDTHCMLFRRAWLEEIHKEIEVVHPHLPFWKAYLQAIEPAAQEHGASEYELYFHFSLMFHAGELIIRRLRWGDAGSLDEGQPNRLHYVVLNVPADRASRRKLEDRVFPASAASGQNPAETPGE
jgi:FkbM family methyltransferase